MLLRIQQLYIPNSFEFNLYEVLRSIGLESRALALGSKGYAQGVLLSFK